MKNYYDLLEVTNKASAEIIEKAYKVLIKKYHPDLYSGEERIYAEKKTRELNEAYHVLSNEFLREQYDLELEKEQNFSNSNKNNIRNDNENNYKTETVNKNVKEEKPHKVGTFMSIVDLIKNIFRKRNINGKIEIKREDKTAAVLTLIIVVVLGVILWFIPSTSGFMRSLIAF